MMIIVSKGNGKNYYGFEDENSSPVEVVKIGGGFHLAVYKHWELTPVGNQIPKSQFTLVEKTEWERR